MINLPNVTLICIEGTENSEKASLALEYSSQDINFKEVVLISPTLPSNILGNIKYYPISKLTWDEYNKFIIKELHSYFTTDYCILIQTDGFIINSHLWSDEFLKYDYIGAAWDFEKYPFQINPINPNVINSKGIKNLNRVGNGGFTLRSKKLLETTSQCPFECVGPEDVFICNDFYDYFTEHGIKFAPIEIANLFSKDPIFDVESTFGFHGNKDLINTIK